MIKEYKCLICGNIIESKDTPKCCNKDMQRIWNITMVAGACNSANIPKG